ncbi:putative mitochondrial chaperone bcs1 protein [Rosellinia necatrix]|uniref:Putative mitochondrial chaperone bcs1 protein n=1 Tax=Rosellinia necatrix TaxID=77044 RepID=A0A1W2TUA0_ROSNE|nr:putative mitochondrial chaperone bcs1 protein [Rosellinia necatrix]
MPIPPAVRARRAVLSAIAKDTKAALPDILRQLPHIRADASEKLESDDVPAVDPADCPGFALSSDPTSRGTRVKVLNEDTLDAAIMMADSLTQPADATILPSRPPGRNQRVAVLNLASDKNPGGGWLSGAMAQEEALCYRSSLALSLHAPYYPWGPSTAVYTRDVVVMRSSMSSGHRLLVPQTPAAQLPTVSVISVAAIRRPALASVPETPGLDPHRRRPVFKYPADRQLTKQKMRLALRIAARERHELLVLGAIGCGAFRNPPEEVANCWSEVLDEVEFRGGWWREIWFAVLDTKNEGNFNIFDRILGGKDFGKVASNP